jgi:hypothetical protein
MGESSLRLKIKQTIVLPESASKSGSSKISESTSSVRMGLPKV